MPFGRWYTLLTSVWIGFNLAAVTTRNGQANNRQVGALVLGLLAVLGLYAEELLHYKHSLYGIHEYYTVRNFGNSPGCSVRNGNPRELTCPLPGYNSIQLGCLDVQCTFMDQDAPEITPQVLQAYRQQNLSEFGSMPERMKTWDQVPRNDKQK